MAHSHNNNKYNEELADFIKWSCLVRNDRLISTSKNRRQAQNCKDLLIKVKKDPQNIDSFLKDEKMINIRHHRRSKTIPPGSHPWGA